MEYVDLINKKIAIVFNKSVKNPYPVLQSLEKTLTVAGANIEIFELNDMKYGYDFIFAIGGDGTILHVAKFYAMSATPVLGINLGRLGFLSQVNTENIEIAVESILAGKFNVEKRIMLKSAEMTALNDFVVKGASTSRTAKFVLKINDKFVCDYIADGVIISTPTGSTAYGLSAGGPVLNPMLEAFVVVPICPHTLTSRPLVIPSDEKITITTSEYDVKNFNLVVDGADTIECASEISIEKSNHQAHLALLNEDEFYSVLRDKLHWGVSPNSL